MSRKKTIWIPALIAVVIAALLVVYHLYTATPHGEGGMRSGMPQGGGGDGRPAGGMGRPPEGGLAEYFQTMGTIAVFLGAASFSWFWFKRKRKSPSAIVRGAGKLLGALHQWMGGAVLLLIVLHGGYYLITKLHDDKIYTGLAGFAILLALGGYGLFIKKVRNKWMRTIHRTLGLLWVPILLLHAGGSAIIAVIATLAVGGLVYLLERWAGGQSSKQIQTEEEAG